ncbi:MAG: tetratricopeptide repeat protein [Limisphaerales bacterium]
MANKRHSDPRKNFTPRILPWLLAAVIFIVYLVTLDHWATLFNYQTVAKLSGWSWLPDVYNPLFILATYPIRWLPATQIPVALNFFSALCAALTLGLLARSVAILPQDRTDAQREREHSVFSFLTMKCAWLPPVFAVLVCGLELTFWEQATNCTPEMFELLLFAFVVWSLLEYRLDERGGRLLLAAVVFGAGMAENWAMVAFLPLFIVAILWIRGLSFFNLGFLTRMFFCGLVGLSVYLLLPTLAVISPKMPITFWQTLKVNLMAQWGVVQSFFTNHEVRKMVLLLSLASVLPVLVMSIRWKSSFGDNSKLGLALTSFMFHLIHAVLLFVCVWVAFDPPISPRHLGFNVPFLTFYYLGALGVGYFTGYFLLIFGKLPKDRRSQEFSRRPGMNLVPAVDRLVFVGVWVFAAVAALGLTYKNVPQIRSANNDTYSTYGSLTAENLPRAGAICLSDDPQRIFLVQAALMREGRAQDFVLVDTASLTRPDYHAFLHKKFPQKWPDTITAYEQTNGISVLHLISLLATLAKTNELYYLHPSFGYYFEQFCMEPHGLVYKLNTLPGETLLPPPLDKELIASNEAFWSRAEKRAFDPIIRVVTPEATEAESLGEKLLNRFHVPREPNPNVGTVAPFYSRSLNYWGVQAQRANDFKAAASHFETAQKLNPENIVAQVNLDFNHTLQAGQTAVVDLSKATADKFGNYRSWNEVLDANGPFDEPSFTFESGVILMRGSLTRQAVAPFERVHQLAPDNLPARFWLAQCYLASRLPDRALEVLREPTEQPARFSMAEGESSTQLNILAAAAYFQKDNNARGIKLLETEMTRQPTNEILFTTTVQVYLKRGLYTNALVIIDRKLQDAPDDPKWLFGKGLASIQVKAYDNAITAFNHLLTIEPTNSTALFNRAIAYLQSDRLDAARADYENLQQSYTNSVQVAYGLGEIAWRKHETNEAIKNYEVYLSVANTNSSEATNIIQRLRELQGRPN